MELDTNDSIFVRPSPNGEDSVSKFFWDFIGFLVGGLL